MAQLTYALCLARQDGYFNIKSTYPVGMYLSVLSKETAEFHLQHLLVELTKLLGLLPIESEEGVGIESITTWEELVECGVGIATVRTIPKEEIAMLMADALPALPPPQQVNYFERNEENFRCIIAVEISERGTVSSWVLDEPKADLLLYSNRNMHPA